MARVVIADNHQLICEGVRHFLRNHPAIELVAEARSEETLISLISEGAHKIDAILLDPKISSTCDLDLVNKIHSVYATMPLLIFTENDEDAHAVKLIRAGARGFLNKKCSALQLVDAIARVTSGRMYVTELLAEFLALSVMNPPELQSHKLLSQRETEVFTLLVAGKSVTQIARALNLSVKTISTHKTRIMQRMNFRSLSEMVQYAIVNHLMNGSDDMPERTPCRNISDC